MIQRPHGTKLKTILRLINLGIITIFLLMIPTGCVSNIIEINLRADGTSQMGFVLGSSKKTIALLENESKNYHLMDTWPESLIEKAKKQEGGAAIGEQNRIIIPGFEQGKGATVSKTANPKSPAISPTPAVQAQENASDKYKILIATIDDMIKKTRDIASKEGFTCENLEDKDIKGFKALKTFKTYDDMKKLGTSSKGATDDAAILFTKFAKGITVNDNQGKKEIVFNIDMTNELNEINGQLAGVSKTVGLKSEILDAYKADFRVILYKKPESQNATTVVEDPKTQAWTLTWDLKKTKKIELKFINEPPKAAVEVEDEGSNIIIILVIPFILIVAFIVFMIIKKRRESDASIGSPRSLFDKGTKSGGNWNKPQNKPKNKPQNKRGDKWNL